MSNKKDFTNQKIALQSQVANQMDIDDKTIEDATNEINKDKENNTTTMMDIIVQEGGPSKETVDQWKDMYGDQVYATRFSPNEIFIYRYVTRPEVKKISKQLPKNTTQAQIDELFNELLFNNCVLYPTVSDELKATIGAGTVDAVAFQIKYASNYLPEAMLVDLIQKL